MPSSADDPPRLRRAAHDAFVYTAPLIMMAATRTGAFRVRPGRPQLQVNRFQHLRRLTGPENRLVSAPNNDTLFSSAWLDLRHGPATLTLPPTGDRYLSAAIMNMYSDNDAVLGTRTVGNGGGRFTILGPDQAGAGPDTVRVATPHAWLLVRTLVDGPADLDAAHAVQDRLGLEGREGPPPEAFAGHDAGWADYFTSAAALLRSDPPPATDARMLAAIAPLGLTAPEGFDPSRFGEAEAEAIAAGLADARADLAQVEPDVVVDGWSYPAPDLGVFAQNYRLRAQVALYGLAALPRAEAMYMRPVDPGGTATVMTGDDDYALRFAPGELPPLDGFWSLTLYEMTPGGQLFPTRNPIDRYSIGDRTPGLQRDADGGLEILVSRRDPGQGRRANWLPAPEAGPYRLTFRTYLPRAPLMDGAWRLPPLRRATRR